MHSTMNSPYPEAVQLLCVAAGCLMEDANSEAVTTLSQDPGARRSRLASVAQMGIDASILAAAAEVLERRFVRPDKN